MPGLGILPIMEGFYSPNAMLFSGCIHQNDGKTVDQAKGIALKAAIHEDYTPLSCLLSGLNRNNCRF
jgi:hypothetical protein